MVVILKETFVAEIKAKKLRIIEGDAREHGPNTIYKKGAYVVAANIPYYITGELIRASLTANNPPLRMALLVQKEVAERIARSKKESILSLSVKVFGTPRYVTTVKRGNFTPPPKVDSAILSITDISRKHFKALSEKKFFDLLHVGFGQKRKSLAGNLKRAFKKEFALDKNIRAEDVSLATWLALARDV